MEEKNRVIEIGPEKGACVSQQEGGGGMSEQEARALLARLTYEEKLKLREILAAIREGRATV